LDKKLILSILGLSLAALVILFFATSGRKPNPNPILPWKIEVQPNGATKVLGLTLGQSTMADARRVLHDIGEMNLFISQGKITLEGYFNSLFVSGIKADFVLSLSLDPETLDAIYKRGARISQLGSGVKKVDISPKDTETAATGIIQRITYLPAADLDGDMISNLFGKPDSIIPEDSGIEHWLYPKIGLDVAVNQNGKEVFQYVHPANFDEVTKPLLEMKSKAEK
jgi:hypothetical protein